MNRLLTLASTGLFAAGLVIFPVSVFAQPNAATGTDMKPAMTATAPVVAPTAKDKPAVKDASKDGAKDAVKAQAGKDGAAKSTTTPAHTNTPVKVGG